MGQADMMPMLALPDRGLPDLGPPDEGLTLDVGFEDAGDAGPRDSGACAWNSGLKWNNKSRCKWAD